MSALWLCLRLCQFKISWDTLAFNIEKCAKNFKKKPPKTFWFFFTELKNVLKITKKTPETSRVLSAELRQNQEDPALLRSTMLFTSLFCCFVVLVSKCNVRDQKVWQTSFLWNLWYIFCILITFTINNMVVI